MNKKIKTISGILFIGIITSIITLKWFLVISHVDFYKFIFYPFASYIGFLLVGLGFQQLGRRKASKVFYGIASSCILVNAYLAIITGLRPPIYTLIFRKILGVLFILLSLLPFLLNMKKGNKFNLKSFIKEWKFLLFLEIPILVIIMLGMVEVHTWLEGQIIPSQENDLRRYSNGGFVITIDIPDLKGFGYVVFNLGNLDKLGKKAQSIFEFRSSIHRKVEFKLNNIDWDGTSLEFNLSLHDAGKDNIFNTKDDHTIDIRSEETLKVVDKISSEGIPVP